MGIIRNGFKFKRSNGAYVDLRMRRPGLLLVTGEYNYAVGQVMRRSGPSIILRGFYQKIGRRYIRFKVPIGNAPALAMDLEELHQFPENYQLSISPSS